MTCCIPVRRSVCRTDCAAGLTSGLLKQLTVALEKYGPHLRVDNPRGALATQHHLDLLGGHCRRIATRLVGHTGSVIGRGHSRERQQRVFAGRRLNRPDIEPGAGKMPIAQCLSQRGLVVDTSARGRFSPAPS